MQLQLILGHKLNGDELIVDLTKLPNLLISGAIIKANHPARIAFKVQNKRQSITVLDDSGTEKLKSPGDFIWSFCGEFIYAHAPLSMYYR